VILVGSFILLFINLPLHQLQFSTLTLFIRIQQHRQDLEHDPENSATLACIDRAAFVLCLDDESPNNAGDRYTQFLLNGAERPFANRWLDKTLQLLVTANGLSGETYEHTKLDGLDARGLHSHLCQAVLSHTEPIRKQTEQNAYAILECRWSPIQSAIDRISHVTARARSYGPLEYTRVDTPRLGLAFVRGTRSPPNATAHLAILLALYLADGEIRPAWEKVTQGIFAQGRVEWVQTMTPAARTFVTAAAMTAGVEVERESHENKAQLRRLFDEATSAHSRAIAAAGRGQGAVGPLYALRAAAAAAAATREDEDGTSGELPKLFRTQAWDATRRGGPGQEVKIGFMRFDNASEDDHYSAVDGGSDMMGSRAEAGFLVPGERGVYVHCNVQETQAQFAVSGKPRYVARVCQALERAAGIVAALLDWS